jgi:hypothetical protein
MLESLIYLDMRRVEPNVHKVLHNATSLGDNKLSICSYAVFLNVASKMSSVAKCNGLLHLWGCLWVRAGWYNGGKSYGSNWQGADGIPSFLFPAERRGRKIF